MAPTAAPRQYRADIDGLRAIAVLSVLGFHLGFRQLDGGFVGVDIFFVISGYLIGGLIVGELAGARFSIAHFYERRIRRILPALFAMLGVVTIACLFALYPGRLARYGASLVATVFSVSNFYFLQTTGYFDQAAETKPLLHTWSLAIEEQFYIFLPPFLMLVHRFAPSRLQAWVAATTAASLLASVIGVSNDASAAFYLPFARAWELLLGVLLAISPKVLPQSAAGRNAAASVGLAMIGAAVVLFSPLTPFPGIAALLPCVGAVLVIAAGSSGPTLAGRLLSWRPLVFIGLISYSLYLWHWPVIVLGREMLADAAWSGKTTVRLVLLAVSFVLAILSWRFVERPFRTSAWTRRQIFTLAGAAALVLAAAGVALHVSDGLKSRYPPEIARIGDYLEYPESRLFRSGICMLDGRQTYAAYDVERCLEPAHPGPNILLIGDSYAAHLYPGLAEVLPGANVLQATATGCKPGMGRVLGSPDCVRLANFVLRDYLPRHHIDLLVISGRWYEGDFKQLGNVIDWAVAHKVPVVVAGRIAEYDQALPELLVRSIERDDPALPARHLTAAPAEVEAKLRGFVVAHGAGYASTIDALCPAGKCDLMTVDGVPLQFDFGHLTREGSVLVISRLVEAGALAPLDAATARKPPPTQPD